MNKYIEKAKYKECSSYVFEIDYKIQYSLMGTILPSYYYTDEMDAKILDAKKLLYYHLIHSKIPLDVSTSSASSYRILFKDDRRFSSNRVTGYIDMMTPELVRLSISKPADSREPDPLHMTFIHWCEISYCRDVIAKEILQINQSYRHNV